MKKEIYILIFIFIIIIAGLFFLLDRITSDIGQRVQDKEIQDFQTTTNTGALDSQAEFEYKREGLNTNTAVKSIDLKFVLNGGPGKDGIPAINEPKFFRADEEIRQKGLADDVMGLAVSIDGDNRFYPYSVLYWHEIVNDTVGDKNVSVTFCPLCGSAIVYEREVNGKEVNFGVSGKLYESNLLMYDNLTHTLWSQSIGEAVVGDYTGAELTLVKSDLITYDQFKQRYPQGLVLSEDTGFFRSYGRTPYGSYESDNDLYFPVRNTDDRLHKKELLFIMPFQGESYAFIREELRKVGTLNYQIGNETMTIVYDDGIITATDEDGNQIPGYIEMFFSWATQHPESENLWGISSD